MLVASKYYGSETSMVNNDTFLPNWTSPPGETISDILDEMNLSLVEFADQIGYSVIQARDLLQGKAPLSGELAAQLEYTLGASAEFWLSRETQYRADVSRLRSELTSSKDEDWLKELPLKDMISFGWLNPASHTTAKVAECLRFFGVPNVAAWQEKYHNVLETAAFRTSSTFDSQSGAVAAWLRQGAIESASVNCKPWDSANFERSLQAIRTLTRKRDPNLFIPELQKLCAEAGVAVVIARLPSGCRASGATQFISPNKALLLLSFRYLSDDHFWFTFFHEAGHLLLHGKDGLFLEEMGLCTNKEEHEANEFAASLLIPERYHTELENLPLDGREVIRFARKVGVSPGIVVGQLQHRGLITPRQLNNLKTRFSWSEQY